MKRIIALLLSLTILLIGCSPQELSTISSSSSSAVIVGTEPESTVTHSNEVAEIDLSDLSTPESLQFLEDSTYLNLVQQLNSEDYFVENIEAKYISQEYLEEVAYNSQSNVFFGYTLADLDEQFEGDKYVFTVGEDNNTTVEAFEEYDDTYEKIIKNVAVGGGVVLLAVTVSTVSPAIGAPALATAIFAVAAKGAALGSIGEGLFGGIMAGVITGIETNDFNQALKSAALAGSEGLKWGAITGAALGGAGGAVALKGATLSGLTMSQAATIQNQTSFPLKLIKQMNSVDEALVLQNAGVTSKIVNGKLALVQKVDLNLIDESGRSNLARMKQGLAALDKDGKPFELHHLGQNDDTTLAILKSEQHDLIPNLVQSSNIDRNAFTKIRSDFWKSFAELAEQGLV